jgi:orotidine-5'-phosphate decarboxylase
MADVSVTPIVALDVPTLSAAMEIVTDLGDRCRFYKIGGELFTAEGPGVVRAVREAGAEVFLDLKFHDIPNTVRSAVTSAARLGVRLVTVHASGGRAMLRAAAAGAAAAASSADRCRVLAVSVLTSLDAPALAEAWGRGGVVEIEQEVIRLARLSRSSGIDGLVCSALEATAVRQALGAGLDLLIPGIRLAGAPADDQVRVATPGAAAAAGATYIVLGRAVTGASSRRDAMEAALGQLESAEGPPTVGRSGS